MKNLTSYFFIIAIVCLSHKLWSQEYSAISFNNFNDYISTEWNPSFGNDQDFSVDFFIRTDGWSFDPAILSDKDWASGFNSGFNIALASGGNGIDVNVGDGNNRADLAAGQVSDGLWHHVLVSFDRDGDVSLWIDGIFLQSADMSNVGDINSPFNFSLGQDGTGSYGIAATCDLSNVRIWNAVLSFENISDAVCESISPMHPFYDNLTNNWTFQEGTGNTTMDVIGMQNGTLEGMPTWLSGSFPSLNAGFSSTTILSNVIFTNTSTNATSFFWDFGDGETSISENPSHLYFNTGTYDIKLIATGACSVDSIIQSITISELDPNLLTSLDLDGNDDYVELTNDLNFGATNDFTIELFVKSEGWSSDPSIISNKDWASGSNAGFIIAANGDGETWMLNVGDGSERIDLEGGIINDGAWHHIAVSYDQDGTKAIFQDGELIAETTEVLNDINSTLDLAIGQDGTLNYGTNFSGQVAEVRIWSVALDANTISTYKCGSDNTHPNYNDLMHYWKCDEGQGTLIADVIETNNGIYNGLWTISSNTVNGCQSLVPVNDVGSGNAMNFIPDDIGWIDCSGADGAKVSANSLDLPSEALTLECWVKPHTYSIWHSMVSFIQDNGSFEKGWDLETNDGGAFTFTLATNGISEGLVYLSTTNTFEEDKWYHVAGVFDGTEQRIYVNGVLENSRPTDGNIIDYANSWLVLGMYKDDNESFTFDGALDEVRIWSKAKTAEEIRLEMCKKLTGSEEDLFAYYRLDNILGEDIRDYGPNNLTGEMKNMVVAQARQLSGAALGDESVQVYTNDWINTSMEFQTSDKGNVILSDFTGSQLEGAHLYRVNNLPNSIDGIFDLGNNNIYYGTYIVDPANNSSYKLTYDYANYSTAVANEANLNLYNRANNSLSTWIGAGSTLDEANDEVFNENIGSRREIILADFTMSPCTFPSAITLDNIAFSEATLSWVSTNTNFNIEYGLTGFTLGNGNLIANNASNSITLVDLEAKTNYDFYIQSDCGNGLLSAWVGPFTFITEDPCGSPTNIQTSDITSSTVSITFEGVPSVMQHDLQWGTSGFNLGTGIITTSDLESFELQFLPANTDLQFYIRSNCFSEFDIVGDWIGPFDFTTLMSTNTENINDIKRFDIFPNPTNNELNIQIVSERDLFNANLIILNIFGQAVHQEVLGNTNVLSSRIDISHLISGTYFVKLVAENESIIRTLVVRN